MNKSTTNRSDEPSVKRLHEAQAVDDSAPTSDDHAHKILLFEATDEEANRFLRQLKEEIRGCVLWARDAEEAERFLLSHHPVTIVVGCCGAKEEAFRLLAELRRRPEFEHAHVVVLSAGHAGEDICEAFNLGANRFFLKPRDESDYAECAVAIVTHESNLPLKIAQYERFPVDPFCE